MSRRLPLLYKPYESTFAPIYTLRGQRLMSDLNSILTLKMCFVLFPFFSCSPIVVASIIPKDDYSAHIPCRSQPTSWRKSDGKKKHVSSFLVANIWCQRDAIGHLFAWLTLLLQHPPLTGIIERKGAFEKLYWGLLKFLILKRKCCEKCCWITSSFTL